MNIKRAAAIVLGAVVLSAGVTGTSFAGKKSFKPGGTGGSPSGGHGGFNDSGSPDGPGSNGQGTQGGSGGSID